MANWSVVMGMHCGRVEEMLDVVFGAALMRSFAQVITSWGALSSAWETSAWDI